MFKAAIIIKVASAYINKTAFLLFIAAYIGKRYLIRLYLAIHLLSLPVIVYYFVDSRFAQMIFRFDGPFSAQYEIGALWYSIISNSLYVISAVLFFIVFKPLRKKKKSTVILYTIICFNVLLLTLIMTSSKNVLYEKMHVLNLVGFLSFILYRTPFLEERDRFILHSNILEGLAETIVIVDRTGNPVYIHDGAETVKLSERMKEIEASIQQIATTGEVPSEGRVTINGSNPIHVLFKQTPIISDGVFIGRIIVVRDVTSVVELQNELARKNILLNSAFEKHRRYLKLSKKLAGEQERSRILERVNQIANAFINTMRTEIIELNTLISKDMSLSGETVDQKNEELLAITRKALEEIRGTVKNLSSRSGGLKS